jgi:hypothetical protein
MSAWHGKRSKCCCGVCCLEAVRLSDGGSVWKLQEDDPPSALDSKLALDLSTKRLAYTDLSGRITQEVNLNNVKKTITYPHDGHCVKHIQYAPNNGNLIVATDSYDYPNNPFRDRTEEASITYAEMINFGDSDELRPPAVLDAKNIIRQNGMLYPNSSSQTHLVYSGTTQGSPKYTQPQNVITIRFKKLFTHPNVNKKILLHCVPGDYCFVWKNNRSPASTSYQSTIYTISVDHKPEDGVEQIFSGETCAWGVIKGGNIGSLSEPFMNREGVVLLNFEEYEQAFQDGIFQKNINANWYNSGSTNFFWTGKYSDDQNLLERYWNYKLCYFRVTKEQNVLLNIEFQFLTNDTYQNIDTQVIYYKKMYRRGWFGKFNANPDGSFKDIAWKNEWWAIEPPYTSNPFFDSQNYIDYARINTGYFNAYPDINDTPLAPLSFLHGADEDGSVTEFTKEGETVYSEKEHMYLFNGFDAENFHIYRYRTKTTGTTTNLGGQDLISWAEKHSRTDGKYLDEYFVTPNGNAMGNYNGQKIGTGSIYAPSEFTCSQLENKPHDNPNNIGSPIFVSKLGDNTVQGKIVMSKNLLPKSFLSFLPESLNIIRKIISFDTENNALIVLSARQVFWNERGELSVNDIGIEDHEVVIENKDKLKLNNAYPKFINRIHLSKFTLGTTAVIETTIAAVNNLPFGIIPTGFISMGKTNNEGEYYGVYQLCDYALTSESVQFTSPYNKTVTINKINVNIKQQINLVVFDESGQTRSLVIDTDNYNNWLRVWAFMAPNENSLIIVFRIAQGHRVVCVNLNTMETKWTIEQPVTTGFGLDGFQDVGIAIDSENVYILNGARSMQTGEALSPFQ